MLARAVPKVPPPFDVHPIAHPSGARSYVVVDPESREALVVDPILDRLAETQRALLAAGAARRWMVGPHSHAAHPSGAAPLRARTGAGAGSRAASGPRVRRP